MSKDGRDLGTCDKCGGELEMYYRPWCPVCEKPERQAIQTLNLLKCLEHIEAKYNLPGYKERMMSFLVKRNFVNHNDSLEQWPYNEPDISDKEVWGLEDQELKDVNLFNDIFDIDPDDRIWMDISW